jgi:RNA polymerase sigma factor (sigma-70 family)
MTTNYERGQVRGRPVERGSLLADGLDVRNGASRGYYTGQDVESQRLTAEEEKSLFNELALDKNNAKVREKVVKAYLCFALSQAKKDFRGRSFSASQKAGLSFDDAISAANYGLMQAIDRFDPSNGARFTTYAGWWIKKALHEARYSAHVVSVPRGDRENFVLYRRQQASGLTRQGIAELNKTDIDEVERILGLASGRQDPLEMLERGMTNPAKISGDDVFAGSPLEGLEEAERLQKLEAAKNRLGMQELRLLHDRFSRKMPLKKIAARNGCSVHTIETKLQGIFHVLRFHLSS